VTRRLRIAVFGGSGVVLGAFMVWALTGLPDFGRFHGPLAALVERVAVPERHASNTVATIVFDFRGLDTMGEELILFAAVMGVALIFRSTRDDEAERPRDRAESDAVRLVGQLAIPFTLLLGLWLAAFGYVTPGGGFQGGVVLASALLLLWIGGSYRAYRRAAPRLMLDAAEGGGAGGFVALGLVALAIDGVFLQNLFPGGTTGTLLSAGSIPLLNWLSALEVAAANVLLFHEFFDEYLITRGQRR
jgi:multicomponent Na+:H+ antiporter subunit B